MRPATIQRLRALVALACGCAAAGFAIARSSGSEPTDSATISFEDGRVVTAPILKESPDTLWLDLGFTVLEAPRASVVSIERADRKSVV